MPETKQDSRETNLKGRMADSLVFDLLSESGNEVYKIGYESFLPSFENIKKAFAKNSRVGDKVRSIPDFLVADGRGFPHLVEVKFRWSPKGHENDLKQLKTLRKNWEEAVIIFVNCSEKPYFRICHYPFTDKRNKIITIPIQAFSPFGISDGLLKKFDALVEKYFTPTLLAGTRQKLKK